MPYAELHEGYEARMKYCLFAIATLIFMSLGAHRDATTALGVAGEPAPELKDLTQSTWLGTNLSTVAPWGSGKCYDIAANGTITFDPRLLDLLRGVQCVRLTDWSLINSTTESAWTQRATLQTARIDPRISKDFRVPIEVQVALCNTLRCVGWFCVPHLADANYARQMAQLITTRLDPSLPAVIEFSNECWNNRYPQARWCQEQGVARYPDAKPGEAQTRFYVDRAMQAFQIFGPRFNRVLSFHFGASLQLQQGLMHAQGLVGRDLTPFVDAVAIAPYMGAAIAQRPDIADLSPRQVLLLLATTELPRIRDGLAKTVEFLNPYNLPLWAYESGQHLVDRQADQNVQDLFRAVNTDPQMETLYRAYFRTWLDTVGPNFCLNYSLACKPSNYGYWGLVDSLYQTDSPKLRAFRAALSYTE